MKAVGYFVTSRNPAGSKPTPLVAQERAFYAYCERQGYEPVATFMDKEDDLTRPGYHQMLQFLSQPEKGFMLAVVQDVGALGATAKDSIRSLLQIESTATKVASLREVEGDLLSRAIEAWEKRADKERRGEQVRAAMRAKAIRGEALGRPAFGYRIGAERRFEIVPQEAEVIHLIYRLYVQENLGLRRIAGYLNEKSIPTRKGGRWSVVAIRDILRSRTYTGTYSRLGVRVPGSHPPIVPQSVHQRVQARLASSRQGGVHGPPSWFLLSGLAYCGCCGNRMVGVNRRQSWKRRSGEETHALYRYYQCQSRTNQSVCHYHTRRAPDLEAEVETQLRARFRSPAAPPSSPPIKGPELKRLQAKLLTLDRRLRHLLEQAAKGAINSGQLRAQSMEIIQAQEEAQERLRMIEDRARHQTALAQQRQRLMATLETHEASPSVAETRNLLRDVVDRIVVFDDRIELVLQGDA